ncbi:hypothetical protein ASE05_30935 [Mesorhizobium sp. Root172]|nr:hypothetical protein ASE05_30935 [Mesorhizobium sp. Root172]
MAAGVIRRAVPQLQLFDLVEKLPSFGRENLTLSLLLAVPARGDLLVVPECQSDRLLYQIGGRQPLDGARRVCH